MQQAIKKGAEAELSVEKLAFGGKAICRVEGYVVFIEHALPGQRVRALITRRKRQFAEARVLEVLEQSPHYVEPFCPHFGVCGGCQWQDLRYREQLHWKRLHVVESLQQLAGVAAQTLVEPTVASPQERYYRNKMEFTFSNRRWLLPEEIASRDVEYSRSFCLGLHVRGFFDKIFDVQECYLESPRAVAILREARAWCRQSGLAPYSTRDHQGFWRFLVIREGKRTDQTLVHIFTALHPDQEQVVNGLSDHLLHLFPEITTIVHSVTQKKAQVAFGDVSRTLFGPGWIEEELGRLRFQISAHSFFQTNPLGAEKLYEAVGEFAGLCGGETVWDLYCGAGSIALSLAPRVERVVGFEVVDDAVQDAYRNARLNGISNCSFVSGDLKDMIRSARESNRWGEPGVVVTDPPRAGMHPHVVQALLELAPERIVYVSCNPSTLARDLALLQQRYTIGQVRPFDLFPHTPHIECVVKLERRES